MCTISESHTLKFHLCYAVIQRKELCPIRHKGLRLNVTIWWLVAHLVDILKVPCLNFNSETDYPEVYRSFTQSTDTCPNNT